MSEVISIKNIQPFLKDTHTKHRSEFPTTSELIGKGKLLDKANCFDGLVDWGAFECAPKSIQHIQFTYVMRFGDEQYTKLYTKSVGDSIEIGMACGIGNRKEADPETGFEYESNSLWYFKGEISGLEHIFSDVSIPLKTSDGSEAVIGPTTVRVKVKLTCPPVWYKDVFAVNALPDKTYSKGEILLSNTYRQVENARIIAREIANLIEFLKKVAWIVGIGGSGIIYFLCRNYIQ